MTGAPTVGQAALHARRRFAAAGIETADLDARVLVGHAVGLDRAGMIAEAGRRLDERTSLAVEALVARRLGGEPVGRILGQREFWGLRFRLGPDTLEPRPDSETVVSAALEFIDARFGRSAPIRIADLGTGTGCLLIALLSELPQAEGLGTDISEGALGIARRNVADHGLSGRCRFAAGSWLRAVDGQYHAIVSNPPYIESRLCASLDREVCHDPARALDGGADGLDAYRAILADLDRSLRPDGIAVLETGAGQCESVAALAGGHGMRTAAVRRDLAGIERALVLEHDRKAGDGETAAGQKMLGMQGRTG